MFEPRAMGVVVVGDELLSGKRQDRHLSHVIEVLGERGMQLAWCRYVSDDCDAICETLLQTQLGDLPVFCFGGIGATPDDQTRQAAARAFGTHLELHQEAVHMIQTQFGPNAYPNRIRMAELPADCLLIPNRINRVPGFTLYDHHFFPGFPQLAWPMLDWVLGTYYPSVSEKIQERSVQIPGAHESDLYELMEVLASRHRDVRLFSLPRMGSDGYIELGFRGRDPVLKQAFADLIAELNAQEQKFEIADDG